MLFFDLVLMRILLIGIISFILFGIFFVTQKRLGYQSRFILLIVLLILPLLAFPMLSSITLPAEAPDWLLDIRLPDPEQQFLTERGIGILTEKRFKTENPVSAEISTWLNEHGYEYDQEHSDLISLYLPLLQLIYWFGFLLSLSVNIILMIRRLRKRTQYRSLNASNINQADWQAEVAQIRDELGIYRKSDIVLAGPDEHHISAILQNWFQRTIPVPASEPMAVDPSERRVWLLRQLRLNARPRIILTIIWLIARSLLWFNPWIDHCFKSLIIDHLEKNQVQLSNKISFRWIPSGIVLISIISSLTIVSWQIPRQITRDLTLLKIDHAPELTVNILDKFPDRTEPIVSWIFDQKTDDYGFALLDVAGEPIWFVTGREIWGNSSINDLSLLNVWKVNAVQMPDQSWSLMANMTRYKSISKDDDQLSVMSDSTWHLHISCDGSLIRVNKVVEHPIAQMFSDRIVASASQLNDGSYLLTDRRSQSASLSNDINITLVTVKETSWFDVDGTEINILDNNSWLKTFNFCNISKASRYGSMEFIAQNEIEQYIPIRDNCVGLLNTRGTIALIPSLNPKNQIQTSVFYQAQYRFICLDSIGHKVWQKDLTDPGDGIMIQTQYLSDGEMIYWQGSRFDNFYSDEQSYSKAYVPFDTIIALNTANATSWKLRLDEEITENFSIAHWIAQNNCLSFLLTGIQNPNDLMICQLDQYGKLIGLAQLDHISDYYLYRLVETSPGRVSLFKYSSEG